MSFAQKTNLGNHILEVHNTTTRGKKNCFERFFDEIKWGAVFICISCHMTNFARNVDVFDDKLRAKLEERYMDPKLFETLNDEAYYHVTVQNEQKKISIAFDKDGDGRFDYYICRTYKKDFQSKKMPSRCILNECRMALQPDCLKNRTEVEVCLIALNLQFKKVFRLP